MSTHGEWETLCITVSGILCVKHVVKRRDLAIGIGDLQENEKKKEEAPNNPIRENGSRINTHRIAIVSEGAFISLVDELLHSGTGATKNGS